MDASLRAIAQYRTAPAEDRSVGDLLASHLDLARAHLVNGDVDGAAEKLTVVLDAAPQQRTASIARRLRALAVRLGAPPLHGIARCSRPP
ncbi:hypothetical protein [Streptomyces sp. NPDC002490]|uniref:hypothetical protein n=1 Tax=Streptomyces sp. NPDC002490 TaxID=3154416 RepID=UPI003322DAC6